MNHYRAEWYQHSQLMHENTNRGHHQTDDPSMNIGGAATLGGTYIAAGLLIRSGNPAAMAAGATILAIPDPLIYAVGHWIFS